MKTLIPLLPVHSLKLKALAHKRPALTQWESKFVDSLRDRTELSTKQLAKVEEIYSELRDGRKPHFDEFRGMSPQEAASLYDFIHDFDRD